MPNAGAPVPRTKQEELLELLRGLDDMSCLIVSGSLSPEMDPSFYDEVIDIVREKGAEFVLDISHAHLRELIEKKPLLIKPNDDELADIFGEAIESRADAVAALGRLHERGAQNVLLTLGGDGAYFSNGEHVWHASAAEKDSILSTACAATPPSQASCRCGSPTAEPWSRRSRAHATGANVTMCAGLGDFARVDELAKTVHVKQVA